MSGGKSKHQQDGDHEEQQDYHTQLNLEEKSMQELKLNFIKVKHTVNASKGFTMVINVNILQLHFTFFNTTPFTWTDIWSTGC